MSKVFYEEPIDDVVDSGMIPFKELQTKRTYEKKRFLEMKKKGND